MDVERFYDSIGEKYLDGYTSVSMRRVSEAEQKMVIDHMPSLDRTPDVLEIGTGPGRLSAAVSKLDVHFSGVDISLEMLQACRRKLASQNAFLAHCDVSKGLPFRDASFDYVYSVRVMKYTKDLGTALSEVFRVLRPGGILLTTMLNPWSVNTLNLANDLSVVRRSHREMTLSLRSAGFDQITVIGGPKLPDMLYTVEGPTFMRALSITEFSLQKALGRLGTRELFYLCRKPL